MVKKLFLHWRRASILPAVVSLVLGLTVCWQAHAWLYPVVPGIDEPRYLAYRRSLESGHPLQFTDLKMLPARSVGAPPRGAITDQDLVALKGAVLTVSVTEDQLVVFSQLELSGEGTRLGKKVPLGTRAFPIRVTENPGLQASDFVDVILTPERVGQNPATLAEGVAVLSVQAGVEGTEVLVALTPEELELVEKGLQTGKLKLALRNPAEAASPKRRALQTRSKAKRVEIWEENE